MQDQKTLEYFTRAVAANFFLVCQKISPTFYSRAALIPAPHGLPDS